MKTKNIVTIIAFLALCVAALWWFAQPAAETPVSAKVAQVPASLKPTTPAPTSPSAPVSAPKIAPEISPQTPTVAPASPVMDAPITESQYAADGAAAPQAEARKNLTTAIPELIRLLEANDQPNLFREFTPLDAKLANMRALKVSTVGEAADHVRKNPSMMKDETAALGAIQESALSPTVTVNGTIATYLLPSPVNNIQSVVFEKKGGFWYLKSTISRKYTATD